MWTRLVAGAAAHDLNNLAQGLFNLLDLASGRAASPETIDRYAALASAGLQDLRTLGNDLRTLADAGEVGEPQRLDLALADAVAEAVTRAGRTVKVAPSAAPVVAPVLVRGTSGGLRLAFKAVLRYALAASAPGGVVHVTVAQGEPATTVVVVAPTAFAPRTTVETTLAQLLGGDEREFGGDAGLVLAGAATQLQGGEIVAGPAPGGGLRFKLTFARADESPEGKRISRPASLNGQ
jgi:signal transduction histidine kinase